MTENHGMLVGEPFGMHAGQLFRASTLPPVGNAIRSKPEGVAVLFCGLFVKPGIFIASGRILDYFNSDVITCGYLR
jgi:hypothetical protein